MRKFLCGGLLLLMSFTVSADNDLVSGNTLLTNLPKGSVLLAKQKIDVSYSKNEGDSWFNQKLMGGDVTFNSDTPTISISEGDVLLITMSLKKSIRTFLFYDFLDKSNIKSGNINFSSEIQTVDDFNSLVGSYFQIVENYTPNYSGIDKSIVVDIVITKITATLKSGQYAFTIPDFRYLEKLGEPLPESFYYNYTNALEKSGYKDQARMQASAYLQKYGKKGKHYAEIIQIMSKL